MIYDFELTATRRDFSNSSPKLGEVALGRRSVFSLCIYTLENKNKRTNNH